MRSSDRALLRLSAALPALLSLLLTPHALALNPFPPYGAYPCSVSTTNCQGGDPVNDLQFKVSERSDLSSCATSDGFGNCFGSIPPRSCPGSSQWCLTPRILSISHSILSDDGTVQLDIEYDFPNNYCQVWDPPSTWPTPQFVHNTRLQVFPGPVETNAIFEHGRWKPTFTGSTCSGTRVFTVKAVTFCASPTTVSQGYTITFPIPLVCKTPDKRTCGASGGGGSSAGGPVNIGSGDVMYGVPFFTLAQTPFALSLGLTYHSERPLYPRPSATPVGDGWTHPYAQTLFPVPGDANRLHHIRGNGDDSVYLQASPGVWNAERPGELRGQVTLSGSQYLLTDLDGTVTAFDVTTGRWLSTTDRWGNAITGAYVGNDLTALTDSAGGQVALTTTGGKLTQISLGADRIWRLEYDGEKLAKIFDPLHTGAIPWKTFSYQADSQAVQRLLTAVRDDAGFLIEGHSYDTKDRGTTSVSEGGRSSVTIQYDFPSVGRRRVTHAITGTQNEISDFVLTYQKGRWMPIRIDGTCATCGGATSNSQSFLYDSDNHLLSRIDADTRLTNYVYNADGNVTSMTEAVGGGAIQRTRTYAYGYFAWPNFRTEMTEPSAAKPGQSKITTFAWNTTGAPEMTLTATESGFLLSTDPAPTVYTTTTTFDTRHRLLTFDGPRTDVLDVTTNAYYSDTDLDPNRRGRIQTVTDPVGLVTTYDDYDVFGTARKVTDPNGVDTTRTTDTKGRMTSVTSSMPPLDPLEPPDYTTTYGFDSKDRLTDVTLPRGNGLHYEYENGTDRLTDTVRVDSSFNQQDRLHLTLNVIGGKTMEEAQSCDTPANPCALWTTQRSDSFSYDTSNRLSTITHPDATTIVYTYDPRANLKDVKDERHTAAGANTLYTYDLLDRLTRVTQKQTLAPPGPDIVTNYTYDAHDNLRTVQDPNSNTTTYLFDDFRRMQRQTSPVSGVTNYSYDPAGNLTSLADANSATATRTYDAANRVLTSTSTRTGRPTETVTTTYDDATAGNYGLGRIASMTDPAGSTTYAYERRGFLRSEGKTIQVNAYSQTYGYDPNGNRTSITYPSTRVVTYTFDFADRPNAATGLLGGIPVTYVTSATYRPFGPETTIAYGNATTKTMTYDARYRPQENKLVKDADPLNPLARYTYTQDGVGNITQIADNVDAGFSRVFDYDNLNRLTTSNSGTSLWGTDPLNKFSYDSMGSMLSLRLGAGRIATFAYAGTTPKLTTVTENSTPRSVGYDLAGNELTVGAATYTYSARNFLSNGDGLSYVYDGRGLRTVVTNSDATPASRYSFYSPELSLMSESELTTAATPAIAYEYIWFNSHPVAQENAATRWTFTDHLGTPLYLTDVNGDPYWRAEYEPYGKVWALRTTDQHQPLRLPGQEAEQLNLGADGLTERSYNIFRWYRPAWGRYTQADPAGLAGSINLFGYAEQNPETNFDPFGLKVCRCDRRLANYLSAATFSLDPLFHHSFIQIVPDSSPCGGLNGVAWGFQNIGRVLPEQTPTLNPQLSCVEVPCIDEGLLKKNIVADMHQPPFAYKAICRIGRGWNSQNCQAWADSVLDRTGKRPCCQH